MWNWNDNKEKKPCEQQEKSYIECLKRFNNNTEICRGEIFWLKYCSEFEKWVEHSIQDKLKQAKGNSMNTK